MRSPVGGSMPYGKSNIVRRAWCGMDDILSKYLAIGILLGLMGGFVTYLFTDQVLFIEAGAALGIVAGAVMGLLLSRKK